MFPKKLQDLTWQCLYHNLVPALQSFIWLHVGEGHVSLSFPKTWITSVIPTVPLHFSHVWSICFWKISWDFFSPIYILRTLFLPLWGSNVVQNADSSSNLKFQWLCKAPSSENRVDAWSLGLMSSSVWTGQCSPLMVLLRSFGSKQTLNLPFSFSDSLWSWTSLEWHSVAVVIPCPVISSTSFFSLFCNDNLMLCGACATGFLRITLRASCLPQFYFKLVVCVVC